MALLLWLWAGTARATLYTAKAAYTGDWADAGTWTNDNGAWPGDGDDAHITNAGSVVIISSPSSNLNSVLIGKTLTFTNWTTCLTATNVTVLTNGTVNLPVAYSNTVMSNRVWIICTNFTLCSSGQINAKGKGYRGGTQTSPAGHGPGKGTIVAAVYYGGGAGHGGRGGPGPNGAGGGAYDSTNEPALPGSGGAGQPSPDTADGAAGGGAVRIAAADTVTIDGTITADGLDTTWTSGGGSGGSIYITCRILAGNGVLTAKGGKGSMVGNTAGGGGGGRIAVVYDPAAQRLAAKPGVSFNVGMSIGGYDTYNPDTMALIGTLYLPDETLFKSPFDNFKDVRLYGVTNWAIDSLVATGCAIRFAEPEFHLTVTNTLTVGTGAILQVGSELDPMLVHEVHCADLVLTNGGMISIYSGPTNTGTPSYGGLLGISNGLWIATNSWLTPVSDPTNGGSLMITVSNVTIAAGGGIDARGQGYRGWAYTGGSGGNGYGPGKGLGTTYYGGGAGYGGTGAVSMSGAGGGQYGSSNAPIHPGSGGGGSGKPNGGGSVRIEAAGPFRLDGAIMANGTTNVLWGGGGSGGGIFIACNAFAGGAGGRLSADGGNARSWANYSGGGGGGRISILIGLSTGDVQKVINGQPVDGLTVYPSYLPYAGSISAAGGVDGQGHDGGAGTKQFMKISSGFTLFVASSPALYDTPSPYPYGLNIDLPEGAVVTNTVTTPVDEGGGLRRTCFMWVATNVLGGTVTNGTGAQAVLAMTTNLGLTFHWTNEYQLTVSSTAPDRGSVNSAVVDGWYTNGVQVTNITAIPSNTYMFSRWSGAVPLGLETNNPLAVTMDQARSITAYFASTNGELKVWNGTVGSWMDGARWIPTGVPGPKDQVIVGTGTVTLGEGSILDSLTVSNGATMVMTNWNTMLTASNVVIQGIVTLPLPYTNGAMSNRVYLVCTNFTLAAGAQVNAQGKGYRGGLSSDANASGHGPGKGITSGTHYGGGGGHGGRGGPGNSGAGGGAYDSTYAPALPGSGGAGQLSPEPVGGAAGGGAVRIAIAETCTVDGTITADATDTTSACWTSGGGSGGSIHITCKTLAGSGMITAKGAKGDTVNNGGGGGGGGRIAVVYDTAAQRLAAKPTVRFNVDTGLGKPNTPDSYALVGTLYLPDESLFKSPFDNFNNVRIYGPTNWAVDGLVATNCGVRFAESRFRLTVTNTVQIGTGTTLRVGSELDAMDYQELTCRDLILTNGGRLYVYSGRTNGTPGHYGALVGITNDLVIGSNSWFSPVSEPTNGGSVLVVANNVAIGGGGGFDADGCGYRGGGFVNGFGPGKGGGNGYYGGGGGYGGIGGTGGFSGTAGGVIYGLTNAPIEPGSGGGGYFYGYGGGSVRIQAAGAVTLNGSIKASGYHSGITAGVHGGGGSGGGIFIACGSFSGAASGRLSADGGNSYHYGGANYGGGGGGGRIAVAIGIRDNEITQLVAGLPVTRLNASGSYAQYYGAISVTNGITVNGTLGAAHDGKPGSVVFLYSPSTPGTVYTTY